MDIREFTDAVEVIDMHTHICRSPEHGQEMYAFFMMGFPTMSGPSLAPCSSTLQEAEQWRTQSGVRHLNMLMFTWSGRYYQAAQHMLPDDPAAREDADRALRQLIVRRIQDNNQWAVETAAKHAHLTTFCGIDPIVMDTSTLLGEVEARIRQGASGIKMVPLDLGIRGDDDRLWPLYDYLQSEEIPLQTESSDIPGVGSRPGCFEKALCAFPDLKIVFSHMGHGKVFGEGADAEFRDLARRFDNVRGDLSERLLEVADGHVTPQQMVDFVREVGADRVMYGSNNSLIELSRPDPDRKPEDPPQRTRTLQSLETFAKLPLTDIERRDIAARNFRQLVGLA